MRYYHFYPELIPNKDRKNYEFTDGNCYKEKCGVCPLEKISLEEIENAQQPKDCVRRNDKLYCILMAKAMLNNTLHEYMPVSVYFFDKCNHFCIDDGRHRICIAEHLINNNIECDLPVRLYQEHTKCSDCKR